MDIQPFIKQQLPPALLARMPKLFQDGHQLANDLRKENPILGIPSFQFGDLRGAAIDFVISKHLFDRAYPGITAGFKSFFRPTGKFLKIETPGSNITISHVDAHGDVPRHAMFRKLAKERNQAYLFEDLEEERLALTEKPHLQIVYGNKNLEFLHIGAMHPRRRKWLEAPLDLLSGFTVVVDEDSDVEGQNAVISMELKKQQQEEFIVHLNQDVG